MLYLGRTFFMGQVAKWLPLAQYWYNMAHHSSLGMTPYRALFGQVPPNYVHYHPKDSTNHTVDSLLRAREVTIKLLKDNLAKAQQRMKIQAVKHTSERVFAVGDWVYLKLQLYRQHSVHRPAFHKLSAKYFGPFMVLEKVGQVAYKLELPAESKIHNVFHVSLLKRKLGNHTVASTLPPVSENGEFISIPVKIMDRRMTNRRNKVISEVLVQWSNSDADDNTWEEFHDLQNRLHAYIWAHYNP